MEKVPALASLTRGYTLAGFPICRHWTLDNFFLMRSAQLLRVPGGHSLVTYLGDGHARLAFNIRAVGSRTVAACSSPAPLGLTLVLVGLVPARTDLTVTGCCWPRHLKLAARSNAGQYNLRIL